VSGPESPGIAARSDPRAARRKADGAGRFRRRPRQARGPARQGRPDRRGVRRREGEAAREPVGGRPVRLLIAIVVWIGAVAGAAGVSSVVAGSIHNDSTSSADVSLIKGGDASSMFRTANFSRALTAARSSL